MASRRLSLEDEPDPRPLPSSDAASLALESAVQALSNLFLETRLEADLPDGGDDRQLGFLECQKVRRDAAALASWSLHRVRWPQRSSTDMGYARQNPGGGTRIWFCSTARTRRVQSASPPVGRTTAGSPGCLQTGVDATQEIRTLQGQRRHVRGAAHWGHHVSGIGDCRESSR